MINVAGNQRYEFLGDLEPSGGRFETKGMSGRPDSCPDKSPTLFYELGKNPTSREYSFIGNSKLKYDNAAGQQRHIISGRSGAV